MRASRNFRETRRERMMVSNASQRTTAIRRIPAMTAGAFKGRQLNH
jgi:hypothetical protein